MSLAGENGALLAGLPAEACLLHERRPWGGEILGRVHRGGCEHLLAGCEGARVVLPRDLVTGQGLTWIGPRLLPPEDDVVKAGDRGIFLDYEGDAEHYVVEFENAVFCCAADDVHPYPRPPVPVARRHNAT